MSNLYDLLPNLHPEKYICVTSYETIKRLQDTNIECPKCKNNDQWDIREEPEEWFGIVSEISEIVYTCKCCGYTFFPSHCCFIDGEISIEFPTRSKCFIDKKCNKNEGEKDE